MIQKVLEEEIKAKVNLSDPEVELYYLAHRDRYGEKEAFKIRTMTTDEDHLEGIQKAMEDGERFSEVARRHSLHEPTREKGGEVEAWIEEGLDPTGMGDPGRLWEILTSHEEGEVTAPIRVKDAYYLFQIISHRPPRTHTLEEARKQAEADLYRERVEKAYRELIQQALQGSEVKVFPERLHGEDPEEGPEGSPQE
jgi:hypothetical protein